MNEREFAERYLGQFKIKGNEIIPKYCPICGGGVHKDKETFGLNMDKHIYKCQRGSCGATGTFKQICDKYGVEADYYVEKYGNSKIKVVEEEYKKPTKKLLTPTEEILKYFLKRGIGYEVVEKYVSAAKFNNGTVAAFRFTYHGEHVFTKFRNIYYKKGDKTAKEVPEKDGKPVLWNIDNIDYNKPVILTEGMIDALSVIQAGYDNVVSVPMGCNNFKWIDLCWDEIQKVNEWILYMDNDDAGYKMKEEILNKFADEKYKFSIVNHELKDANEELMEFGEQIIKSFIDNAQKVPLDGVIDISDVETTDITKLDRIETGNAAIDFAMGGYLFPSLNVWSGQRAAGKSTMLYQTLIPSLEKGYNAFVYTGELDAGMFKLWFYNQIATERHLECKADMIRKKNNYRVNETAIKAIDKWLKGRLWIFDNRIGNKKEDIILRMKEAYKRYNCKLFVLDNLTVIRSRGIENKYEAQSDLTDELRQFAINTNSCVNLVVHPRKGDSKTFDNDDVGGSGDITNLAFNVIYVRRVKDENDLTETEMKEASEAGLNQIDSIVQVTKNRVFGDNCKTYMSYNPKDKRFSNRNSYIASEWQKYLPEGYKDNLGKVYSNSTEPDFDICPF